MFCCYFRRSLTRLAVENDHWNCGLADGVFFVAHNFLPWMMKRSRCRETCCWNRSRRGEGDLHHVKVTVWSGQTPFSSSSSLFSTSLHHLGWRRTRRRWKWKEGWWRCPLPSPSPQVVAVAAAVALPRWWHGGRVETAAGGAESGQMGGMLPKSAPCPAQPASFVAFWWWWFSGGGGRLEVGRNGNWWKAVSFKYVF